MDKYITIIYAIVFYAICAAVGTQIQYGVVNSPQSLIREATNRHNENQPYETRKYSTERRKLEFRELAWVRFLVSVNVTDTE